MGKMASITRGEPTAKTSVPTMAELSTKVPMAKPPLSKAKAMPNPPSITPVGRGKVGKKRGKKGKM